MKLLFCRSCGDVLALQYDERVCVCGEARGRYLSDGWHAEIVGAGRIIAIPNFALSARRDEPAAALPAWFQADGERRKRDRLGQIVVDFTCCGGSHDPDAFDGGRGAESGDAGPPGSDPDRRLVDPLAGGVVPRHLSEPDVYPGLQRRVERRRRVADRARHGDAERSARADDDVERERVRPGDGTALPGGRVHPTSAQAAILTHLIREQATIRVYGDDRPRLHPGNFDVHATVFRGLREAGWIERQDTAGNLPEYGITARGRRAYNAVRRGG